MPARLRLVGGKRRAQRTGSKRSNRGRLAVQPRANRPRTYRRLATIRRRDRHIHGLSRYRRLNIIFERSKEHLIAFVAIAFISILSRRLKRLVVEELSA